MKNNESGIIFEHDDSTCSSIKFDEHNAYKKVDRCLKPTKGVDFIYIYDNNKLVFLEVKNFLGHTSDPSTQDRLKNNAEELMTEIALKVRDSIACATAAARYSPHDVDFWNSFNNIFLDDTTKILIIAWIEFDGNNEKEKKFKMSLWREKLKKKLKWLHAAGISVNNINNPPPIALEAKLS